MANKTMLQICYLLNQCDGCPQKKRKQEWSSKAREEACGGCPYYQQMAELRPLIDSDIPGQYKKILDKGEDMTLSEIAFLVEKGVEKTRIQDALNMTRGSFDILLQNIGLRKKRNRKAVTG